METKTSRESWKSGTLACAVAAGGVFLLNLTFVLWAEAKAGFPPLSFDDGKRLLYKGNCNTTKQISLGAHLLINLFGTVLLGASNYCMQCISAPTREEVDRAHAKNCWMDIGVPSVRNLRYIGRIRVFLWCLLGLSSLPLHVVYNSTVFPTTGAVAYDVFSASEAFGRDPSAPIDNILQPYSYDGGLMSSNYLIDSVDRSKLERLEVADCLSAYSQIYQTSRGNIFLIVTNNETSGYKENTSTVGFEMMDQPIKGTGKDIPHKWICVNPMPCSLSVPSCQNQIACLKSNLQDWKPFRKDIEYCLSERIPERCQVGYNVYLAITVLISGMTKAAIMIYVAFKYRQTPLLTAGDAVASFLWLPDASTRGSCLADKRDIRRFYEKGRLPEQPPKRYNDRRVRRIRAASSRRIAILVIFFFAIIATIVLLLQLAIRYALVSDSSSSIWNLGLGAVRSNTLLPLGIHGRGVQGFISVVLIANSPQLVFSFFYLAYNGLVTTAALATEWSQYANVRKGLRVSGTPKGSQRSTYFLQLPYRLGLPLMIMCATIHWMISQSLFIVNVDAYDPRDSTNGTEPVTSDSYTTCGYSPLGIVVTLVLGILTFGLVMTYCHRPLKSGMPVVGSCSAAIAAVCQPGKVIHNPEAGLEMVQWGVIPSEDHCTFSSEYVDVPRNNAAYI